MDPGVWTLPVVTWSCQGFLSELVQTSTSLAWSLSASSHLKTLCVVLFPVSLWELALWGDWNVYLWTSVLLRCYLHFFSQSLSIVIRCGVQLPNVIFSFLSATCIQWPVFARLRMLLRRVARLRMLYKVNANSNHSLFCELPSAPSRVRQTWAAAAVRPLEIELSRCRISQFERCLLPAQVRIWNDFPYTLCLTPEHWMGSMVRSTVGCFPELCFLQFSLAQVIVGLRKQFKQLCFCRSGKTSLCSWV